MSIIPLLVFLYLIEPFFETCPPPMDGSHGPTVPVTAVGLVRDVDKISLHHLTDSEVMYHEMIKDICEKYGKKYTKDFQIRMCGVTDKELCSTVVGELKLPISADEMELQLGDLAKKTLPSAPIKQGAERLLVHLNDYRVPLALATNSTEQAVRLHATARPKLFGLFHHRVCACDPQVGRGKPHPDIYLVAAARFPGKPKPIQCLVFEDSACGVNAANAAGMQVVMVPAPRLERELKRHATLVLRSLLDFKPELFGLPPFQRPPDRRKAKDLL